MIIKKSPFDLQDFVIINNVFRYKNPPNDVDPEQLFSEYKIDIDYIFQTEDELFFQVFIKVLINESGEKDGYSFTTEGIGFFQFESDVSTKEKVNYLNFSGIPMCINSIRSFVGLLTSHSPMGKYLLPSIDLNDLVEQKNERIKKVKKNKKVSANSK